MLFVLVGDNVVAWENEEDSVRSEHRKLIKALNGVSSTTTERRLVDLLRQSQSAWEDEEDSVKAEHEELMERNIEALDGIPARQPATPEQLRPGTRLWWRDPDNGACSKVVTVVSDTIGEAGDAFLLKDDDGSDLEAYAEELFFPAVQPRSSAA